MVQCLVVKKAFKHTGLHLSVIYSYFEAENRSNEQIHIRFIDHNIQFSAQVQGSLRRQFMNKARFAMFTTHFSTYRVLLHIAYCIESLIWQKMAG